MGIAVQMEQALRHVAAAEVTRNFGMWQDRAAQGPLVVTHHGRPRVILMAVEQYQALVAGRDDAGDTGLNAARLSVMCGQIGRAFASFDADLRFTQANATAMAHFGKAGDALVGRTPEDALGERGALLSALLREALRSGETVQADLPAGFTDARPLRLRAFPWPGGGVAMLFRNGMERGQDHDADAGLILGEKEETR